MLPREVLDSDLWSKPANGRRTLDQEESEIIILSNVRILTNDTREIFILSYHVVCASVLDIVLPVWSVLGSSS